MIKRARLLKEFSVRKLSASTQMKASEKFLDMTDQQKEERASQMLTLLKESRTEQEFISKIEKL